MKYASIALGLAMFASTSAFAGAYSALSVGVVTNTFKFDTPGSEDLDDFGGEITFFHVGGTGIVFDARVELGNGDASGGGDYDRTEYSLNAGIVGLLSNQVSAYGTAGFHGLDLDFGGSSTSDSSGYKLAAGLFYRTLPADFRVEIQRIDVDEVEFIGAHAQGDFHVGQTMNLYAATTIRQGDDFDSVALHGGLTFLLQ